MPPSPASSTSSPAPAPSPIGFREFVALVATIMATNALAIDAMLPAMSIIGSDLGVGPDGAQWVLTGYLLGFGVAQLFYGTLSDRFGRKPVLLLSLLGYTVFGAMAAFTDHFGTLILARVGQGVAAAGSRVLVVSVVRDRFQGEQMARVMSLAYIVFMIVPVLAPALGQAILLVAPWPAIFGALAAFGLCVTAWSAWRLPETHLPHARLSLEWSRVAQALKATLSNRQSMGYTLALGVAMGTMFGFLGTIQPLFAHSFHAEGLFPLVFGAMASCMAVGSLLNARLVARLGMRRMSHGALVLYLAAGLVHLGVAYSGHETMLTFALLQALTAFSIAGMASNFGALAMEPMAHVAGTASSVQGSINTVLAALIGAAIGQSFDGTAVPYTVGLVINGLVALAIVALTERGRLFAPLATPSLHRA